MGILNVTPDSFSDGGRWQNVDDALAHAIDMANAGADIIDVGGESTRPGADSTSAEIEIDRVIPVIRKITAELETPVSIDTSKPEVMIAAVEAGATMINDVLALREPRALETAARLGVPVCLMHMQGQPRDMQHAPSYQNVVAEVEAFLLQRATAAQSAGIRRDQIVLDPGFGFGKSQDHNIVLFRALPRLAANGYPVLVGVSRKSMLGRLMASETADRIPASVVAAVIAARKGASILRVHDVTETVDAIRAAAALDPLSD